MNRKIKILYIITTCQKSGPTQQILNLIKNLDSNVFETKLITVYKELENVVSLWNEYIKVLPCTNIPTSKTNILFGNIPSIKKAIDDYKPDVIHTSGVFPDYMISRLNTGCHVMTSRNYVYDDYISKYGRVRGIILAKMHLYAMTHTPYARTCSKSLHDIYLEKEGLNLDFIRNGVDVDKFYPSSIDLRVNLRKKLGLPENETILIYGASFNKRKNHSFLLEAFIKCNAFKNTVLLLVGEGEYFEKCKELYGKYNNILMPGASMEMPDYLRAADYYVSSSKSEGLPNGVIEALATGLPVLLSDIPQHEEILDVGKNTGYSYEAGNIDDFSKKLDLLLDANRSTLSNNARNIAVRCLSAQCMSRNYQELYRAVADNNM